MTRGRHPYCAASYVAALAGGSPPLELPEWESAVLRRPIPETDREDAAGVYPMTPLCDRHDIEGGLERCRREGLVSLVLVADPLTILPERLRSAFPLCRAFKTHYLVDPAAGAFAPTKHHRDRIRRGHRRCRVEIRPLAEHLDAWRQLYAGLRERREITGVAAFSPAYFDALAEEPALRTFVAFVGEAVTGMTLWFEHGGVVYNHLTAVNGEGYANGASFALYDSAITYFEGGVINLGGSAGAADSGDGLAQFKAGFANGQVQAHLCGAVLDPEAYGRLAPQTATDFFPAYRAPP